MSIIKTSGNYYNDYSNLQSGSYSKKLTDDELAKEAKQAEKDEKAQLAAEQKEIDEFKEEFYDDDATTEAATDATDDFGSTKEIFEANGLDTSLLDENSAIDGATDADGDPIVGLGDSFLMGDASDDLSSLESAAAAPFIITYQDAKAQIKEIKLMLQENIDKLPNQLFDKINEGLADIRAQVKNEGRFERYKDSIATQLQQFEADITHAATHDLKDKFDDVMSDLRKLKNQAKDNKLSDTEKTDFEKQIKSIIDAIKEDPSLSLNANDEITALTDSLEKALEYSDSEESIAKSTGKSNEEVRKLLDKHDLNIDATSVNDLLDNANLESALKELNPELETLEDEIKLKIKDYTTWIKKEHLDASSQSAGNAGCTSDNDNMDSAHFLNLLKSMPESYDVGERPEQIQDIMDARKSLSEAIVSTLEDLYPDKDIKIVSGDSFDAADLISIDGVRVRVSDENGKLCLKTPKEGENKLTHPGLVTFQWDDEGSGNVNGNAWFDDYHYPNSSYDGNGDKGYSAEEAIAQYLKVT